MEILKNSLAAVLIAALLIGCGRLAVIVGKTEIGWETIQLQLWDASCGWLGQKHEPIDLQQPKLQAEYWLTNVDDILDRQESSAAMKMGAAWVLDSPGHRFIRKHLKQTEFAGAFPQLGLTLDQEAIADARSNFEKQCHARCLKLAEHASIAGSKDISLWRMRALLQFDPQNLAPRHSHWKSVLNECFLHDPNNALYDYLTALQLWKRSAEYDWPDESDWPEDEYRLLVHEPDLFKQGNLRFELGQNKPFLAIGEDGLPAVTEFLKSSRLPIADQAEIAVSRLVTFRQSMLFNQMWRWLGVRADHAKQSGETENHFRLLTQQLRMFDQFVLPEEISTTPTAGNWYQ